MSSLKPALFPSPLTVHCSQTFAHSERNVLFCSCFQNKKEYLFDSVFFFHVIMNYQTSCQYLPSASADNSDLIVYSRVWNGHEYLFFAADIDHAEFKDCLVSV